MTEFHSPWPLFSDDLELARSWVRPQLRGVVPNRIGHVAISLGLGDALLDGLRAGELQAEAKALRQWNFRVARSHGDSNPYRHLLPEGLLERIMAAIANSKTSGHPLDVAMHGGIGDHIEALSLLLPWAKAQNLSLNLEMNTERKKQIEPLLPQSGQIRCSEKLKQGKRPTTVMTVMALRAAISGSSEPTHYCSWLSQEKARQPINLHWLCCWRAEGSGDRLSAHSRSVPWALVQKFYQHLQCSQPKCCIVDITNWRDWEASQLRGMGVEILTLAKAHCLTLYNAAKSARS